MINRQDYAVSPYNFISLPNKVYFIDKEEERNILKGLHGRYEKDRYHGWIDLSIKTLTPLYTRCASPDQSDYNNHDFYYTEHPELPMIPGSSIRGLFRSLLEITTSAKLVPGIHMMNKKLVYRDISNKKYRKRLLDRKKTIHAGYLFKENGDRFIRPAKKVNGKTFVRISNYQIEKYLGKTKEEIEIAQQEQKILKDKIFVKLVSNKKVYLSREQKKGFVPAKLLFTGYMDDKKKNYCIFEEDSQADDIKIPREIWDVFQEDNKAHRSIKTRTVTDEKKANDPDKHIVFYLLDQVGNLEFLGTTMMMRLPYQKSTREAVPFSMYREQRLDIVDSLFGRVNPDSIKGRLFFSDALLVKKEEDSSPFYTDLENGVKIPHVLNNPKPTSYQMYLEQNKTNELKDYNDSNITIRGRKMYWHKPWVTEEEIFQKEKDLKKLEKVDTKIRPVKPGTEFNGKIYFYNLTSLELGSLLWLLKQASKKGYALKLGMGKPLGMGSIEIQFQLHLENRIERYQRLFEDDHSFLTGEIINEEEIQKVMDNCINDYKQTMAKFHNKSSFEELPFIKELIAMMNYKNAPNYINTQYQIFENKSNEMFKNNRNFSIKKSEQTQWRKKLVLQKLMEVYQENFKK